MTTTPGPNFASTPVGRDTLSAVRITQGGKPLEKAVAFLACIRCWSDTTGGGLMQDGACSNGCGQFAHNETGGH